MELVYLRVLLWNLFTWECYCNGTYLPECYCGTCLPESVIVVKFIYLGVLLWNLFT